jgi:hypothetical protein
VIIPAGLASVLAFLTICGMLDGESVPPAPGQGQRGFAPLVPVQDDSAALQNWTNTLLARPLFSPGRRPAAVAAISETLPPLSAIVISGTGAVAIFTDDEGMPVNVRIGGEIAGYKVAFIGPNMVRLAGPVGDETMHLQFAQGPTGSGAALAAQPSSSSGPAPGKYPD